MSDQTIYIKEKSSQIDHWIAELAKMDELAREAGEEVRIKLEVQMNEFSQDLKAMQNMLKEIENADEDKWEELRVRADKTWISLTNSYDSVKSEFKM